MEEWGLGVWEIDMRKSECGRVGFGEYSVGEWVQGSGHGIVHFEKVKCGRVECGKVKYVGEWGLRSTVWESGVWESEV